MRLWTLHPKYLTDGADRSIELETLARDLLTSPRRPAVWPLLQLEQQALERLDTPYFTLHSDADGLSWASPTTPPSSV